MRKLNGLLPTEMDMNQTHVEINYLNSHDFEVPAQLQGIFRVQIKSAENQLRIIRYELIGNSLTQKELLNKHWETLSTTLKEAGYYCA